jgi:hypothetical protein
MFVQVPASEWLFSQQVNPVRAQMLHSSRWNEIVREIVAGASYHDYDYEEGRPGGKFDGCWRPTITVHVAAPIVDRFHNGAGGIRAQHYDGPRTGMRATQDICAAMLATLVNMWIAKDGLEWHNDVRASFASPFAKAWIDQGSWILTKPLAMRNLLVPRWVVANATRTPPDKPAGFRFWASLMPDIEDRLDFKGAWVKNGVVFDDGAVFMRQAQENHDFGYS